MTKWDRHFNNSSTFVTDGMGTVQRINLADFGFFLSNNEYKNKTQDQGALSFDHDRGAEILRAEVNINRDRNPTILNLSQKRKYPSDNTLIETRVAESLRLSFAHGFSMRLSASENVQVSLIVFARKVVNGTTIESGYFESALQSVTKEKPNAEFLHFYLPEFKNSTSNHKGITDDYVVDNLWLTFKCNDRSIEALSVTLQGPLFVYQNVADRNPMADRNDFWKGMGDNNYFRTKFLERPVSSDFIDKIYENLMNTSNQLESIRLQKLGKLETEMNKLGFQYFTLNGKLDNQNMFKFFAEIQQLKIPFETGNFGKFHGAETHALQIFSMTRGLNEEELTLFKNIYREIGHNSKFGWKIWSTLFDSPFPDSPLGPKFWVMLGLRAQW